MSMYETLANNTARIYEQLGQGQADAALQRGRIWGQTLANIGGIVSQIPEQQARLKEQQGLAQERQQRGQMTAMQMQQMQRDQQGENTANAILSSLPKNPDGTWNVGAASQKFAEQNVPLHKAEPLLSTLERLNQIQEGVNAKHVQAVSEIADHFLTSHPKDEPFTDQTRDLFNGVLEAQGLSSPDDRSKMLATFQSAGSVEDGLRLLRDAGPRYQAERAKIREEMNKPTKLSPGDVLVNPTTQETIAQGGPRPFKDKAELAADASDPKSPTQQQSKDALALLTRSDTEKGLQSKSVLVDGKPTEVTFDPATGRITKGGRDGEDVTERAKPMPPASVVYPQAKADRLIKVEHKDPQTGRTVIEWLPQSEVRGQVFQKGASGATETRLELAQANNQTGEDIIKQLSDPNVRKTLGPLLGRATTVREFIGNPPPQFSELAGSIESYAISALGVHGMRNYQASEKINKMLDAKHTPESLASTIRGLNRFTSHFMENEGRGGGSVPAATSGGGGEWIDLGNGLKVRKK